MPGRYSLRGRAKPTGFYNEDYDPLKPQTSAARAKKALAKRKAKTATKAPAKATAKTTKNAAAKKEDEIPKDLDKSFIGKYKPELIRPPKRQTWKHDGDTPITDIKQAPTGWTSHDADLDPK
jgi:sRNA-binding protein